MSFVSNNFFCIGELKKHKHTPCCGAAIPLRLAYLAAKVCTNKAIIVVNSYFLGVFMIGGCYVLARLGPDARERDAAARGLWRALGWSGRERRAVAMCGGEWVRPSW